MTALTSARYTRQLDDKPFPYQFGNPIAANQTIYVGGMCGIITATQGYISDALTSTTFQIWGVAMAFNQFMQVYNNSAGAAGAFNVRTQRGCFAMFSGTAGDLLSQATVGKLVYVIDDQTVGLTNGGATRSLAGVHRQYDADGTCWIELTPATAAF
jgi:hypothetical protein